jgi:hypothetical protein
MVKNFSLYRLDIRGIVSIMAVNEMRGFRKLLDDANPEPAFERRHGKEGQYNKADGE